MSDPEYVCIRCGKPKTEEDIEARRPGITQYKPCSACGAVGMLRSNDTYQELHKKKTFRELYERSRTRGGRPS